MILVSGIVATWLALSPGRPTGAIISPGAVESELKNGTSDPSSAAFLKELYEKVAIPADSVARAVLYAIQQPADVEIDEVVLRPTSQDF